MFKQPCQSEGCNSPRSITLPSQWFGTVSSVESDGNELADFIKCAAKTHRNCVYNVTPTTEKSTKMLLHIFYDYDTMT